MSVEKQQQVPVYVDQDTAVILKMIAALTKQTPGDIVKLGILGYYGVKGVDTEQLPGGFRSLLNHVREGLPNEVGHGDTEN